MQDRSKPPAYHKSMKPLQPAIYNPADKERSLNDIRLTFEIDADAARDLCGVGPEGTLEDCLKATQAVLEDETHHAEVWINDQYQVSMRRFHNERSEGGPDLVHLSIKRLDKEPCRDWRDFQAIKNQLVGPECEGMELYPAESRIVDTANQYHIWVIDDPTFRYPWGFNKRVVIGPTAGTACKQRAL